MLAVTFWLYGVVAKGYEDAAVDVTAVPPFEYHVPFTAVQTFPVSAFLRTPEVTREKLSRIPIPN